MILKTVAYVSRGTILITFLKQQNIFESFRYLNGSDQISCDNF